MDAEAHIAEPPHEDMADMVAAATEVLHIHCPWMLQSGWVYAAFGRLACQEESGVESENIARAAWKHDHAAYHAELGACKEESGVESERIARAAWTDDHAVYDAEL